MQLITFAIALNFIFTGALDVKIVSKSIRRWSAASLATIGFMACGQVSTPVAFADPIPAVGVVAPDFTLPSNTGKEISLKDLKGKRTVLYFYPVCTILYNHSTIITVLYRPN